MVEMILGGGLDQAAGRRGHQLFLGLALKLRVAQEHRQHAAGAPRHILGGELGAALVADQLAVGFQRLDQGAAETALVAAAERRRHGVAVGIEETLAVKRPGHRPFHLAVVAVGEAGAADEGRRRRAIPPGQGRIEKIGEPAGEMEGVRLGRVAARLDRFGIAGPADFDAAEQIGLRARHAVDPAGVERRLGAEDLRVGQKRDAGAAPVVHRAVEHRWPQGGAALIGLAPQFAIAGDLDGERAGQGVDHRQADPVEPAGGVIDLVGEFAAGMEGRQDDLEGRAVLELGMLVHRNAAAVVAHADGSVGRQLHLDARGVAGHRLVHGVVENLGEQVMHGACVGAADIHGGTAAHRLQALENLDVLGRIIGGHGAARRLRGGGGVEQVGGAGHGSIIGLNLSCINAML